MLKTSFSFRTLKVGLFIVAALRRNNHHSPISNTAEAIAYKIKLDFQLNIKNLKNKITNLLYYVCYNDYKKSTYKSLPIKKK